MNQEENEQHAVDGMKKGADFTGKVMMNIGKKRGWWFVMRMIQMVTEDEERVLHVDWTEISFCT